MNKSNPTYRTWPHPDMAIEALDIAHHWERYRPHCNKNPGAQNYIDKRRLEHGNDRNGHYGTDGV